MKRRPMFIDMVVAVAILVCHGPSALAQSADDSAETEVASPPASTPTSEPGPRNPTMMYWGIGLTATGGALGITGGILLGVATSGSGDDFRIGEGFAGIGMLGLGGLGRHYRSESFGLGASKAARAGPPVFQDGDE